MTETIDTTQPEALRLAHYFDQPLPPDWEYMKAAAAELRRLHSALAAAEARNATLTDDAARAERNRDMWREQCARQAEQLESLAKEKAHDRQRTS